MDEILVALNAEEAERLRDDPSRLDQLVRCRAKGWRNVLNLGEAWAPLHNMISGDFPIPRDRAADLGIGFEDGGWADILMGGASLGVRTEHGHVRLHDPAKVAQLSGLLQSLDLAEVEGWYDPDWFNENHIGPRIWYDSDHDRRLIMEACRALIEFFQTAASARHAVLEFVL